jgi:DNA-binding LacI/PurR family transcriptional regulator
VTGRRLRGYRAALTAAGIELPVDHVVVGPATVAGGVTALEAAWHNGLRPTAVLAMSDAMAIGAMRAIRGLGLSVPSEVSVVGFDDIDLAMHTDPPLTTVHQPIRRKGEEAVRLLLSVVHGRGATPPEHRRLETRLVVRGSTARPSRVRKEVAVRD